MEINFQQYQLLLEQKKLEQFQINNFNRCIENGNEPTSFMEKQKQLAEEFLLMTDTAIVKHDTQTIIIVQNRDLLK